MLLLMMMQLQAAAKFASSSRSHTIEGEMQEEMIVVITYETLDENRKLNGHNAD